MFKLRSGNKPEFRKLSGVASPNKKVDATAVTDKLKDKAKSVANVKDKLKSVKDSKIAGKIQSKVISKGVSKAGGKLLRKAGLVPGVGYALAAKDVGKLMMEQKAKGYAALDKKSPGTSKHLETGAYGMQTSDTGHKVRGTFFGSMK